MPLSELEIEVENLGGQIDALDALLLDGDLSVERVEQRLEQKVRERDALLASLSVLIPVSPLSQE